MKKEIKYKFDEREPRRPFTVPEGYFDNLTRDIMASLPHQDSTQQSPVTVTLWMRIKPYFYMAAAFAGLFFGFRFIIGLGNDNQEFSAQTEPTVIYTDEYIDSFLETAMIDDYTLYYSLVESGN